jgi:acetyltransferase-like isoleucine patch superfamily enzyme
MEGGEAGQPEHVLDGERLGHGAIIAPRAVVASRPAAGLGTSAT